MRIVLAPLLVALALLVPSAASEACKPVAGRFMADAELPCTSKPAVPPHLLCTDGQVNATSSAAFDFTMTSATFSPIDPGYASHRGTVDVGFADGTLSGGASGFVRFNAVGNSTFRAVATVADGTGAYDGWNGTIVFQGALNRQRTVVEGDYSGTLCPSA